MGTLIKLLPVNLIDIFTPLRCGHCSSGGPTFDLHLDHYLKLDNILSFFSDDYFFFDFLFVCFSIIISCVLFYGIIMSFSVVFFLFFIIWFLCWNTKEATNERETNNEEKTKVTKRDS